MGNPWFKALFADLAPKSDRATGYDADGHAARWNRQRAPSSPPTSDHKLKEDYDIAAHARSSLHITNNDDVNHHHHRQKPVSPSYARPASYGPESTANQWRQRSQVHAENQSYDDRPSSAGGFIRPGTTSTPPPPLGPRPALFPQEIPYHAEDNISPNSSRRKATGPGGFISPQNGSYQAQRPHASSEGSYYGHGHASPQQLYHQTPTSKSASPARQQATSVPTQTAHLATPPPRVPHRPASDPQGISPRKTAKSPSVSRSTSDEGTAIKPNQCHGTTGAGKRCTRTVKAKATSSKAPSTPKEASSAPSAAANYRMNHNALKQLDRRLSVRKRIKPVNSSPKRKGRAIEIDSDSDAEDFENARISPVRNTASEDEDLEELPVFCFQHVKQTLEQRGTFINAKSVDFQGKCACGILLVALEGETELLYHYRLDTCIPATRNTASTTP